MFNFRYLFCVQDLNPWKIWPLCILLSMGLRFESPSRQSELLVYNLAAQTEGTINYVCNLNTRVSPAPVEPLVLRTVLAPLLFGFTSAALVWSRYNSPSSLDARDKVDFETFVHGQCVVSAKGSLFWFPSARPFVSKIAFFRTGDF